VLAFVRRYLDETVLVVANLSRFSQYAELDLSSHKGMTPVELFGKSKFPVVGDAAYMLSLGPHGFYWFSLEAPKVADERLSMPPAPSTVECTSVEALLFGDERPLLDDLLPAFLEGRPWFRGRDRGMRSARIEDVTRVEAGSQPLLFLAFVRVEYLDASSELYTLPLAWAPAERPAAAGPAVALLRMAGEHGATTLGTLVDAMDDPTSARTLLDVIAGHRRAATQTGVLVASTLGDVVVGDVDAATEPSKIGGEGHHTTIRYGERFVLELLRRVEEGVSPALEVGRFLAKRSAEIAPKLCGALELARPQGEPMTVALLHAFVPNVGTAWNSAQQELGRYYDRVLARAASESCPAPPTESPLLLAGREPPPLVSEMMDSYRDTAARLGARIAELHVALAAGDGDPAFAPEPYSALDRRSKYQSLRNLSGKVLQRLRERAPLLPPRAQQEAASILARERDVVKSFEPLLRASVSALRIRTHGNLHLGHVLFTGKDFVVTDFQGLEALTLTERRRKRSPLRDLAWMVGSFELAAFKRLLDPASVRESDVDAARPWALHWKTWASASFLQAYLTATAGRPFVPAERDQIAVLFEAFVLERALYHLRTELEHPSGAVMVPLLGIAHILETPTPPLHR
jgi:maltose alpha-D-glucosyltransferase/alpha-amylase